MLVSRRAPILPVALLSLAVVLCAAPASRAAAPELVAVADIGFTDSSGEPADQRAAHETRRIALTQEVRGGIGQDGKLQSLPLGCDGACRLDAEGVEALRQRAKAEGARFLLVGSVHKMSTLVLSMRVAVLDTATGKLLFERLLSFRGDNDAGWQHAGDYVAREVAQALPPA
ncbi:DUF2380 domain-containing protein [Ancylobacter sp.]|uniref:DUF2380 domain-containing protein n=1 Tax=Ancylobacter sp. TaxID=1872567 RepID=UPI003BACEFA0